MNSGGSGHFVVCVEADEPYLPPETFRIMDDQRSLFMPFSSILTNNSYSKCVLIYKK